MKKGLKELAEISNYYGKDKYYVIGGGGNTSYKDETYIWVKGSGKRLGDISIKDFVQLERVKLKVISKRTYSKDTNQKEHEIKTDLNNAAVNPDNNIRPSVETSLHEIINYSYVVHTHPTIVNAILCSRDSEKTVRQLFGKENILYIPFIDPGYRLFKTVEEALLENRKINKKDPKIIFLENHGIIVSSDSIGEIKAIYKNIEEKIYSKIKRLRIKRMNIDDTFVKMLPAIRMMTSEGNLSITKVINDSLIQHFCHDKNHFSQVNHPFTPDMVVYCKPNFLYIDKSGTTEQIIEEIKKKTGQFKKEYGYMPKVIMIKNIGMIAVDNNSGCAELVRDIYHNLLEISYYTKYFGGPRFLTKPQIDSLDNCEVENYRRIRTANFSENTKQQNPKNKLISNNNHKPDSGRLKNKIAIVTGAAQGFGKGIAEALFREGANIVIADTNYDTGNVLAEQLNSANRTNAACFLRTDVSDAKSVSSLINYTVKEFGGLDIIISNAGILHAGSLDEMTPEIFELMTKVNYIGYFHCVKYSTPVMKLQSQYNKNIFMDIIQINSKSGLKGSNKNFAYAGGKFGGIGLTQSFALELMPFNIKVNSICPGNYFEGPLWDDPDKGLFVQYLRTGKVPGAKTIGDVKKYYESQVPANRGCKIEDIMKAIYYVIDQEYETGQAIPVTGGQIMLK